MVSNPGYYSQMATGGSLTQIEDGVDNPHTGLIKALSLGVAGNYVISGFDATSVTQTTATIADGVVLVDGKRQAVTGGGITLSTSHTTGYHLLVARTKPSVALTLINPTAPDKVPAFTAGDVPIAILAHTGSNPMEIQYFGTGKTENSLSIAQPTSGTAAYTEEGKISAPSGASGQGIDIVTTSTNSDIRITPNGNGKIVLDGLNWPIADGSANQVLKTDGGGQLSFVAQTAAYTNSDAVSAVETEAGLDFSTSSSDAIIENTTQDKDIIFKVNDGGASTEVMRIDGSTSRVGIGTNSPDKLLHLSANTDATLRIESTKTSVATNDVVGAIEWEGRDSSTGSAGVGAKIDVINENATPDFAMRFFTQKAVGGTPTFSEKMRVDSQGRLGIGTTSPSVSLEVNGDVAGDKFLVESVQYEQETYIGAGPPSVLNNFNFADTDSIYRLGTGSGHPPNSANLIGALPATANNEGLVFKLIVTELDTSAPQELSIQAAGSDTIVNETFGGLAGAGGSHVITTTGVYELVCFSGSWMLYKIT